MNVCHCVCSYIGAWRVNVTNPAPEVLLQNLAGNWVAPSARFATSALNLPASIASPDWANVNFAASGKRRIWTLQLVEANVTCAASCEEQGTSTCLL